ncbi:MAG: undecaprenyl/decaprenyl-phosphate alpha-N-acetylglucosaminyl 1-phosphate transferase [Treponema sp.]|jgi:UDP-GlcNAc:undecaprenyl-phosphate GlcNAc-1-phosphate transferase|nr:undecaprenyl/decaprenyl-phosphate alpha-N-acetylglucosaminyl 1-phosphate transferase [Treponema sp.]
MVALVLKISRRMAWYDRISERKIHKGNIPRLGGLGFAAAFIAWSFAIVLGIAEPGQGFRFLLPLAALVLALASGIRDDFKPLAPHYRLIFHTGAALCALASGYTFDRILFAGPADPVIPGWDLIRYPLSLLWIVGLTNAINFIDGVDGLAGGVSLLAALAFGLISAAAGITPLLCVCLASAILGFMVFNAPCPRAKIFMGDGGAYFLGFMLAILPLMEGQGLPILHAAAVLMIPILDTTAAVWRRLRDGRRIDSPDRSHTHHKLMNLGLSSRRIDAVLFALQAVLGLLVYAAGRLPAYLSLIPLALAYLAGIGFFTLIHFLNRRQARVAGSALPDGNPGGIPAGPDPRPSP